MAWLYLFVAGLLECGWAIGVKDTDGFTRPLPTVLTLVTALLSIWMLAQAAKTIPVGTAYAVWAAIGIVGAVIIGVTFLGEQADALRLFFLALIVVGVVGLKLVTPAAG